MLVESLHYTQVADGKLIEIFKNHDVSENAIALFNHVLNAQHIWANRILGVSPKHQVWEVFNVDLFEKISNENFELIAQVLKDFSLEKEISYINSKGNYTGIVKDILFHIVNHSTYHRAQIATMLKLDGIEPPITDYIILKREHLL